MDEDALLISLGEVEDARAELATELEALGQAIGANREMRLAGLSVAEIFRESPGPAARQRVREAWSRLNESLHSYRAVAVHCMVDEDGLSLSDVARTTGNARQVISRLYHFASRRA